MSTPIAPILVELRDDHRNMAKLLGLLERQSQAVFDADESGLEIMADIMCYMTIYPDAVHHPKEDKLYAELRAARPDLSQGLGRVSDEHHAIGSQGKRLRDKLEMAASGTVVRRNEIVAETLRYIEALRAHMRWEESDLFRRLDRMVADGHDSISLSKFVEQRDPLFGQKVEERFKTLFDTLVS